MRGTEYGDAPVSLIFTNNLLTFLFLQKTAIMVKLPYGISNFRMLSTEGYLYVDKTPYIEKLENLNTKYHFFLRPRRFGKSLLISALQYYYGEEYKAEFDAMFGRFYIGKHPTPHANSYLVLKFDFSSIRTETPETTFSDFLEKVRGSVGLFLSNYKAQFNENDSEAILAGEAPNVVLQRLLQLVQTKAPGKKVVLLIDEYDHFANELISFRPSDFQSFVSRNGFVRKFYETIKEGTFTGVVERIFATGVSPVTLDSLTSGFNIGHNITLDIQFHEMMGFNEEEVRAILSNIGVGEDKMEVVLGDLRSWYNGYLFNEEGKHRIYNSDMVLYFGREFQTLQKYPRSLLDINISSDYGKVSRMFKIGNEAQNWQVMKEIFRNGEVSVQLTQQFSFEKKWDAYDFASLLFYNGMLTLKEVMGGNWVLTVPNYVIRELYFRFFQSKFSEVAPILENRFEVFPKIMALANDNNLVPLAGVVSEVLKGLSNRDDMKFDEKHLKTVFAALLYPANLFFVKSEVPLGRDYLDLLLLRRPPIDIRYQVAIELKYLKKGQAKELKATTEEGRAQLRRYLASDELKDLPDLHAWLVVYMGTDAKVVEEVRL